MCKLHDQFYNENKDIKDRNISDVALTHRADEIARYSNIDDVQRKDARFISGIMKTKAHLGFGLKIAKSQKSKNSKSVLEQKMVRRTSRRIAQTGQTEVPEKPSSS